MVMLHLARERLDWTPDLLVIDTGVQFDAIYEFRDDYALAVGEVLNTLGGE
jgi:3'-phosphoadenosine 5'-phosphosulfate sulfotransferase (PAPS reductase)/FAD synthetase